MVECKEREVDTILAHLFEDTRAKMAAKGKMVDLPLFEEVNLLDLVALGAMDEPEDAMMKKDTQMERVEDEMDSNYLASKLILSDLKTPALVGHGDRRQWKECTELVID